MHTPLHHPSRRTAAAGRGCPAIEFHRGADVNRDAGAPDAAAVAALSAENAVLARALADAQQRFTRYRSEQRALLQTLQSALLRAHGEAILARSRAEWLDEADTAPALHAAAAAICRTSAAAWWRDAPRSHSKCRLLLVELPVDRDLPGSGSGRAGAA